MKVALLTFGTTFFLDNDPKDVSVQDTTNYAATVVNDSDLIQPAINTNQVEGIIKATLPSGAIFYNGVFGAPSDIDRDVSDTKSGIELTLDANGDVSLGGYIFDYTIEVTDEIFQFPIVNQLLDATSGKYDIYLLNNYTDVFTDGTAFEIINSTNNDQVVTILNSSFNGTYTVIRIDEALTLSPVDGQLQVTATRQYTTQELYDYQYETPTPVITMASNCDKSELTSTDSTEYEANAVLIRTHTLKYPTDLVPAIADIVQPLPTISINPIYTNNWQARISTDVTITQADGLIIHDVVTGTENHDVVCDEDICAVYAGMYNVAVNYKNAQVPGRQQELRHWEGLANKVDNEWGLYHISRGCGEAENAQMHLDNLKTMLNEAGCGITTTSSGSAVSVLVVAVSSGGVSTIYNELVNQWFDKTTNPLSGEHSDGDYLLQTTSGQIFHKESGAWVNKITTIIGAAGLPGSTWYSGSGAPSGALGIVGDYYINTVGQGLTGNGNVYEKTGAAAWTLRTNISGINGTSILFNGLTKETVTGGAGVFIDVPNKIYTMPANTLVAGDILEILAVFKRDNAAIPDGAVRLNFNANSYVLVEHDFIAQLDQFEMRMLITVIDNTNIIAAVKYSSSLVGPGAILTPSLNIVPAGSQIVSQKFAMPGWNITAINEIKLQYSDPTGQNIFVNNFVITKKTQ